MMAAVAQVYQPEGQWLSPDTSILHAEASEGIIPNPELPLMYPSECKCVHKC